METTFNANSAEQAAMQYAQTQNLPIGAKIEVNDIHDTPHHFRVERSTRSHGMLDGGGVRLRRIMPPLRGGGMPQDGADENVVYNRDHILHARTKAQAALLFASEANLPPGACVSVESEDGGKTFFRTPQ